MGNILSYFFLSLLNFICVMDINNNLKEMNFIIAIIALGIGCINLIECINNKE